MTHHQRLCCPRRGSPGLVAFLICGLLAIPATGCGFLARRRNTTNVSNTVQVNQTGRDIATLRRDEYDVIDTSIGEDKSTAFFLVTLPVGRQTTKEESISTAYYNAVDRVPDCDAMMMPRVDVKRVVIPLLLVNIVIKKTRVKGRCIQISGAAATGDPQPEVTDDSDDADDAALGATPPPPPQ